MAQVSRLSAVPGEGKHALPDVQTDDIRSQAGHFYGFGSITATEVDHGLAADLLEKRCAEQRPELTLSGVSVLEELALAGGDTLEDPNLEAVQHSLTIALPTAGVARPARPPCPVEPNRVNRHYRP